MNGFRRFLAELITPSFPYTGIDRLRARATLSISVLFFVLSALASVGVLLAFPDQPIFFVFNVVDVPVFGLFYIAVRNGLLRATSILILAYMILIGVAVVYYVGVASPFLFIAAMPLVYGALALGSSSVVAVSVIYFLAFPGVAFLQVKGFDRSAGVLDPSTGLINVAFFDFVFLTISALLGILTREQERANQQSEQAGSQLRATAQLSQTTLTILDLNELLTRTVEYIRDRFGFYHVQIFLVDGDQRYANLAASTGEIGLALIARGHRLAVGSQSVIGQVTGTGAPLIVSDTGADSVHRANDLLPNTHSEMAVPLLTGNRIVGALDIQSTRPNAFAPGDLDSFQITAAQIAGAIQNARLFAEQKAALDQNQRLLAQTEVALRENEKLTQRLTGLAWTDYLRGQQAETIGLTLRDGQIERETTWTPSLSKAMNEKRPIVAESNDRQVISVPIALAGQPIGVLEVELAGQARRPSAVELTRLIADRVALSVETARLYEESQAFAQQELTVNAISSRMQVGIGVDGLLRSALTELGQALGAERGAIRLGAETELRARQPNVTNGKAAEEW